ncbi:hypothetical protein HK405_011706, partial [Cladochytrium tenue]
MVPLLASTPSTAPTTASAPASAELRPPAPNSVGVPDAATAASAKPVTGAASPHAVFAPHIHRLNRQGRAAPPGAPGQSSAVGLGLSAAGSPPPLGRLASATVTTASSGLPVANLPLSLDANQSLRSTPAKAPSPAQATSSAPPSAAAVPTAGQHGAAPRSLSLGNAVDRRASFNGAYGPLMQSNRRGSISSFVSVPVRSLPAAALAPQQSTNPHHQRLLLAQTTPQLDHVVGDPASRPASAAAFYPALLPADRQRGPVSGLAASGGAAFSFARNRSRSQTYSVFPTPFQLHHGSSAPPPPPPLSPVHVPQQYQHPSHTAFIPALTGPLINPVEPGKAYGPTLYQPPARPKLRTKVSSSSLGRAAAASTPTPTAPTAPRSSPLAVDAAGRQALTSWDQPRSAGAYPAAVDGEAMVTAPPQQPPTSPSTTFGALPSPGQHARFSTDKEDVPPVPRIPQHFIAREERLRVLQHHAVSPLGSGTLTPLSPTSSSSSSLSSSPPASSPSATLHGTSPAAGASPIATPIATQMPPFPVGSPGRSAPLSTALHTNEVVAMHRAGQFFPAIAPADHYPALHTGGGPSDNQVPSYTSRPSGFRAWHT